MKLQWAPAGRIKGMLLAQRLSSAPGGRSLNLPPELLAVRGFQRGDVLLFNRRGKPLLESFKWSLAEVVAFAGRFASHVTPDASLPGARVSAVLSQWLGCSSWRLGDGHC